MAKLQPFIAKKMVEYIGEEEPTLVNFVMGKLAARARPEAIEEELEKVLESDATVFTIKLWRMLHFEILRIGSEAS